MQLSIIEDGIYNKLCVVKDQNDSYEITVTKPIGSYEIKDIEKYVVPKFTPTAKFH